MIPEEAIEAAAVALAVSWNDATEYDARAALEVALPYFEAALRKQIATELRAEKSRLIREDVATHLTFSGALEHAARVAEKGTTK